MFCDTINTLNSEPDESFALKHFRKHESRCLLPENKSWGFSWVLFYGCFYLKMNAFIWCLWLTGGWNTDLFPSFVFHFSFSWRFARTANKSLSNLNEMIIINKRAICLATALISFPSDTPSAAQRCLVLNCVCNGCDSVLMIEKKLPFWHISK